MKNYQVTQKDFEEIKSKNLKIRWLISELLPYLQDNELKTYQKFFKYSENLEKRLTVYTA